MALVTARDFGIPDHILRRAEELEQHLSDSYRPSSSHLAINSDAAIQHKWFDLKDATALAESMTGSVWSFIPARWNVHPSFSGKPAVYILELPTGGGNGEEAPPVFYVGETSDARTRLQEHRRRRGANLNAIARIVGDKSAARDLETELIRAMTAKGYPMASTKDGIRVR